MKAQFVTIIICVFLNTSFTQHAMLQQAPKELPKNRARNLSVKALHACWLGELQLPQHLCQSCCRLLKRDRFS